MRKKIVFHLDVNSAYLSWEAVYRLQHGDPVDLRTIPSIVGGDPKTRHGIVLAKSIPAKKLGVKTGESLMKAFQKVPYLVVAKPDYHQFMQASEALVDHLGLYFSRIQPFSIDECFLDYSDVRALWGDPVAFAHHLKDEIHRLFGYTVNIGIGPNKLLAKMASEFEKPDRVHTLFEEEIPEKLWPLPVSELFMVGRATAPKLHLMGIHTIGDLAAFDPELLADRLKSHGRQIWAYAHGREEGLFQQQEADPVKGVGNGSTISYDVTDRQDAHLHLLSLTETVALRLRRKGFFCGLVSVSLKTSGFERWSHQKKLELPTDRTDELFAHARALFDETWDGSALRHMGVRVSDLKPSSERQCTLWDPPDLERKRRLDATLDALRGRYGKRAIQRASFLHSGIRPLTGGVVEEDYPMMKSRL
jgi:DNA polymerase-4